MAAYFENIAMENYTDGVAFVRLVEKTREVYIYMQSWFKINCRYLLSTLSIKALALPSALS